MKNRSISWFFLSVLLYLGHALCVAIVIVNRRPNMDIFISNSFGNPIVNVFLIIFIVIGTVEYIVDKINKNR